jgi:hypothetical protein
VEDGEMTPGKRIVVTGAVQNSLAPGRHFVHCGVQSASGISVYVHKALSFVIFGARQAHGIIAPDYEIEAVVEDRGPR